MSIKQPPLDKLTGNGTTVKIGKTPAPDPARACTNTYSAATLAEKHLKNIQEALARGVDQVRFDIGDKAVYDYVVSRLTDEEAKKVKSRYYGVPEPTETVHLVGD